MAQVSGVYLPFLSSFLAPPSFALLLRRTNVIIRAKHVRRQRIGLSKTFLALLERREKETVCWVPWNARSVERAGISARRSTPMGMVHLEAYRGRRSSRRERRRGEGEQRCSLAPCIASYLRFIALIAALYGLFKRPIPIEKWCAGSVRPRSLRRSRSAHSSGTVGTSGRLAN